MKWVCATKPYHELKALRAAREQKETPPRSSSRCASRSVTHLLMTRSIARLRASSLRIAAAARARRSLSSSASSVHEENPARRWRFWKRCDAVCIISWLVRRYSSEWKPRESWRFIRWASARSSQLDSAAASSSAHAPKARRSGPRSPAAARTIMLCASRSLSTMSCHLRQALHSELLRSETVARRRRSRPTPSGRHEFSARRIARP
mmetsp:Transcript_22008/g.66884  ORF Transcript_22008/g.66884 Transcript_22008/m.66884 type:complete len:207 (-) Transcript_22008:372-992(-)